MRILAIDTSSLVASAALLDGDRIVFEGNLENGFTHSQSLMPLVETALSSAGWQPERLEGLALTDGPGSFTGLRIGMATVKGMALALGIPVAAVSTLHSLAAGCGPAEGLIVPVMDARRRQVYTAIFSGGPQCDRMTPDRAMGLEELLGELSDRKEPVVFTGDGLRVYGKEIKKALAERARLAPPYLRMQRAAVTAVLGARRILAGDIRDPRTLAPRYLRGSLALPVWEQKSAKEAP